VRIIWYRDTVFVISIYEQYTLLINHPSSQQRPAMLPVTENEMTAMNKGTGAGLWA